MQTVEEAECLPRRDIKRLKEGIVKCCTPPGVGTVSDCGCGLWAVIGGFVGFWFCGVLWFLWLEFCGFGFVPLLPLLCCAV